MKRLAFFAGALLVLACGAMRGSHYYVVRDLSGGEVYYTTQLEKSDSGYLKLTDAKTHQEVTIPNNTVQEITKDEFNAAVGPGK
jgi:hypothetical protein